MKSLLYLLGFLAFTVPAVYGDGTSCRTDTCSRFNEPCTCGYEWENGKDGSCTYDENTGDTVWAFMTR